MIRLKVHLDTIFTSQIQTQIVTPHSTMTPFEVNETRPRIIHRNNMLIIPSTIE